MDESSVVGDVSQLTEDEFHQTSPYSARTPGASMGPGHTLSHTQPRQHGVHSPPSRSPGVQTHSLLRNTHTHAHAHSTARSPQRLFSSPTQRSPASVSTHSVKASPAPSQQSTTSAPAPSAEEMLAYEAEVHRVLEKMKTECSELAAANTALKSGVAERDAKLAVLEADLQQRNGVVNKLQELMAQLPTADQLEALEAKSVQLKADSEHAESMYQAGLAREKPLQQKLHQQEQYITVLEAKLEKREDAFRSTQSDIDEMMADLEMLKKEKARENEAFTSEAEALKTQVDLLTAKNAAHEAQQQEYKQHKDEIVALKEEQLQMEKNSTLSKEAQLNETRVLLKEMMANVQATHAQLDATKQELEAQRAETASTAAKLDALQNNPPTPPPSDEAKRFKRELASQAKAFEKRAETEKKRVEAIIEKQTAKIFQVSSNSRRHEDALAEAKKAAAGREERVESLATAITRAFQQIHSDKINSKQKLQHIIDTATATLHTAATLKQQTAVARREAAESSRRGEELEKHSSWLEKEWNAAKERRTAVEEERVQAREEAAVQSASIRSLRSENERLHEQVARFENTVAAQSDKAADLQQTTEDKVGTLTTQLATLHSSLHEKETLLQQQRVDSEELAALRNRVLQLTLLIEQMESDKQTLHDTQTEAGKEREAAVEAKNKFQKQAAKQYADLKTLKADFEESKRRLESSAKTVEQLRRQISIKDTEAKVLVDKLAMSTAAYERKEKDFKREGHRREASCKETQDMRKQVKTLISELETIQNGMSKDSSAEQDRLRAVLRQREEDVRELSEALQAERGARSEVEAALCAQQEGERRRDQDLRERTLSTPTRPQHPAERAVQRRQLQNRSNTKAGVDTPYAVLHRNHASTPPHTAPHRADRADPSTQTHTTPPPYFAEPVTEPRRLNSTVQWSPPAFDKQHVLSPEGKPPVKRSATTRSPVSVGVVL